MVGLGRPDAVVARPARPAGPTRRPRSGRTRCLRRRPWATVSRSRRLVHDRPPNSCVAGSVGPQFGVTDDADRRSPVADRPAPGSADWRVQLPVPELGGQDDLDATPAGSPDGHRIGGRLRPGAGRGHRRGAQPLRAAARPRPPNAGLLSTDEYEVRLGELADGHHASTQMQQIVTELPVFAVGAGRQRARTLPGPGRAGPRTRRCRPSAPAAGRSPWLVLGIWSLVVVARWWSCRRLRRAPDPHATTRVAGPGGGPVGRSVAFASEELLELGGDLVAAGHVDVESERGRPPRSRGRSPAGGPSRGARGWPRSARRPGDVTPRPRRAATRCRARRR